jgi:hypothetical protein
MLFVFFLKEDRLRVFCVDNGKVFEVEKSQTRPCPSEFLDIPAFGINVGLWGLGEMCDLNSLKEIIPDLNETFKMEIVYVNGHKYFVKLFKSNDQSVSINFLLNWKWSLKLSSSNAELKPI